MESSTATQTQPQHSAGLEARRFNELPPDYLANQAARPGDRSLGATLKRAIDVTASLALIVVLLPVLAIISLAVWRDSGGPVFFRQRRLGRDMKPFIVLKFRTMIAGSSSELHQRYIAELAQSQAEDGAASNGNGAAAAATTGEMKKLTADPRVTAVGRFLRRTSLDELPQLFNVVGGSMSLIGPRPALEYELEHYQPLHFKRFDVRPGITGLWQVSGRNRLGFHEMLDLDVQYSEETTLAGDVRILARTPIAAFRHGA